MKLNITLNNGTIIKDVYVFHNKELGDSVMKTMEEFENATKNNKIIWFSEAHIKGGFKTQNIMCYEEV